MAILQAPAARSFATVPQGSYTARVMAVKPEDFRTKPDPFGKVGHWSLQFTWQIEGEADEEGNPVEVLHTLKYQTGDYIAQKGARVGHMPWLTEYTRAFGEADIEPGEMVDTDRWNGKRALLGILLEMGADGRERNKVNSIQPVAAARRPTARQPMPAEIAEVASRLNPAHDDSEDIPF